MELQYAVLGFLEAEASYGYELKKLYDKFFATKKPILSGQVYSTLARLKRDGRVEEMREVEQDGGPERIKYQITNLGLEYFQDWLETPEKPAENLQTTLYIKTVLALMRGDDASKFLYNQRHFHIERMRELNRKRNEAPLTKKLLIDHALFHIEADLRWIDLTESRLLNLKKELKSELN